MGHLAQKQHTVTGHHALNEWRHNVDKLNKAQNADVERVQKVTGNAVETRQIESRSERIKQFKSPYARERQLKMTRGWFIQTIKWRPTSIEAKKSILLSKQNHELVQRSKIAVR
jgi:hypothetical protein